MFNIEFPYVFLVCFAALGGVLLGIALEIRFGGASKLLREASEALQSALTQITSKESALTAEAYEAQIYILKEDRTNALARIAELETTLSQVTELRDDLNKKLVSAMEDIDSMLAQNDRLMVSVSEFEQQISLLQASVDAVEVTLDTDEFVDAVEVVLAELASPANPYETGVFNGVVSVSNSLFGTSYDMKAPTKTVSEVKPVRDGRGRFVKAGA